MKKVILISAILIILGYLFRDKTFYINIGDTYYVISYLIFSIFLISLLLIIYFFKFFFKKELS